MNWIHNITRPGVDENGLYGFILKTSDQLTLVAEEYEFCLDGYKVVRNADLDISKPTPSTRYGTRLLKKEGIIVDAEVASLLDISSWHNLLRDLRKMGEFVIVEDEEDGVFLIGSIRRVNKKSVTINYFDGTGKWQDTENIQFDSITCVGFRSRYLNIHRKYIEKV